MLALVLCIVALYNAIVAWPTVVGSDALAGGVFLMIDAAFEVDVAVAVLVLQLLFLLLHC